jgi:hypothetical protein
MRTIPRPPPPAEPRGGALYTNLRPGSVLVLTHDSGRSLRLHATALPREAGRTLAIHHPGLGLVGSVSRIRPRQKQRFRIACPGWTVAIERTRLATLAPGPRPTEGRTL